MVVENFRTQICIQGVPQKTLNGYTGSKGTMEQCLFNFYNQYIQGVWNGASGTFFYKFLQSMCYWKALDDTSVISSCKFVNSRPHTLFCYNHFFKYSLKILNDFFGPDGLNQIFYCKTPSCGFQNFINFKKVLLFL